MLIEAALRCLAREGIQGFTIDRICTEAGVSRGLINHYFDGKDGLLIAVYRGSLYDGVSDRIRMAAETDDIAGGPTRRLMAIVEATFDPEFFARDRLRIWLALWDEIAVNPALRAVHRDLYGAYRNQLAEALQRVADARGLAVDAATLARSFLALVDGLWLEWCLDDAAVDAVQARSAALGMLEAQLGVLDTARENAGE
jgi:AcrR family transcriptional regulator